MEGYREQKVAKWRIEKCVDGKIPLVNRGKVEDRGDAITIVDWVRLPHALPHEHNTHTLRLLPLFLPVVRSVHSVLLCVCCCCCGV